MRLPFMQLESDFLAHGASELGILARCSPAQAIGHVSLLRAWAVSHASDEAPPDGWVAGDAAARRIEAAAQWTGEPGVLLQALLDAGQVRREEGGIRVLHLEPYVQAWNKNNKAKERMRTLRERSMHAPQTPDEGSAKFRQQTQTQTQTQTQKDLPASQGEASAPPDRVTPDTGKPAAEEDIPEAEADEPLLATEDVDSCVDEVLSERPVLELEVQRAGRKPRPKPPEFELYENLEKAREEQCQKHGVGFVPSRWEGGRVVKQLRPFVKASPEEQERFAAALEAYFQDPIALTREPPFSLDFFVKCLSRYEGRAVQAAGGVA